MQLIVNGNKKELPAEKISVADLLEAESVFKTDGIAVAVNCDVVPKSGWPQTFLKENDQVLIIKATQGG